MSTLKCKLLVLCLAGLAAVVSPLPGQQKLGQTGMKFLNVGSDARATAMGEAFTATEASSSSLFYNPAGMARQKRLVDVMIGQTRWIADINHQFASVSLAPLDGDFGVVGISVQFVDYGDLDRTIRDESAPDGYRDLGKFSPSAFMTGLGYAFELSPKFSVGGNVKYVSQHLGNVITGFDASNVPQQTRYKEGVVAFDLGVLYKTGFRSLNFGMTVRNFSSEARYEHEGFQLPLIFKIGVSMNVLDLFDSDQQEHVLMVDVDAVHPRDYPEQLNIGGEYMFMNFLALRAGYMFNNDEFGLTAGVGVRKDLGPTFAGLDYSFTPFDVFDDVHRLSIAFSF